MGFLEKLHHILVGSPLWHPRGSKKGRESRYITYILYLTFIRRSHGLVGRGEKEEPLGGARVVPVSIFESAVTA